MRGAIYILDEFLKKVNNPLLKKWSEIYNQQEKRSFNSLAERLIKTSKLQFDEVVKLSINTSQDEQNKLLDILLELYDNESPEIKSKVNEKLDSERS